MASARFTKGMFLVLALVVCASVSSMATTNCATVTSTDDSTTAATTSGTLRYAIAQANAGTCDTLSFSLTYPATIILAQGQFEISNTTTPITISGPGATSLVISGNNSSRVLQIDGGSIVSISGVTIANGNALNGGGILNSGTISITASMLNGNSAQGGDSYGGAIWSNGTATLTNTTVSGNSAAGAAGGVANFGTLMLIASTFVGNTAGNVGGVMYNAGNATITNSTFSGNGSTSIFNEASVTISSSTFSGNALGFANFGSSFTIKDTILAHTSSGGNCNFNGISSGGYNLSDDNTCPLTQTGDMNNTPAGLDPAGLQNNGGPTQTIALLSTSAAVDKGSCTDVNGNTVSTDQRGVLRPQGSACDIGAFELVTSCVQPPSGTVAWWAADGNANDIVQANNGTLQGDTTFGTGEVGQAFSSDGSGAVVQVPDNSLWNFGSNDFSIVLWANWNVVNSSAIGEPDTVFIGHDEGSGARNKWFFAHGGGVLNFHINDPTSPALFLVQAPFTPTVGVWYHLAITKANGTYTIFVNGTPVGSETNSYPIPSASAPLTIGYVYDGSGILGSMNGLLDEVQVFNRALTAGEVATIYASTNHGVCKPPATSTTVTSSANPSASGENVTFTAIVTSHSGVPSGTVTFYDGTTVLGTGMLNSLRGQATFTTSSLAVGSHSITAAYANFPTFASSSSGLLTQAVKVLQSISVTPANASLGKGQTLQYTANATFTDGTTGVLNSGVTWTSSKTGVATITASGLATAVGAGTTTITAAFGTISGSTSLSVSGSVLVSISVTPVNPAIAVGATQQFVATGTYSDGSTKAVTTSATWTSSNNAVATISSGGLATGVAPGTSTINAAVGTISGRATLTVNPSLVSITITSATGSFTVGVGQTLQLTATGTYSDGSTQNITNSVTWTSSKTSVATISAGGVATGVSKGSTTIKAKLGGITNTTTLTVSP